MFNGRIRVPGYSSGGLNTTFLKTVGSCANAPAGPTLKNQLQNFTSCLILHVCRHDPYLNP